MRSSINLGAAALLVAVALLAACTSRPKNVHTVSQQPDISPDYVGVTIPADIAPLNFAMTDDAVTTVDVEVRGSKGGTLHANGRYADFDIDAWHRLTAQNRGGELTLTVCAERDDRWTRYRDFTISVSSDDLGEWGVTYRRIPPSYEIYSAMGLYQRCLSTFDEEALMPNTLVGGNCVNCHTANRTRPDQYVYHVRGNHGATVVHRDGRDELLQAKNEQLGGTMVYPYWHPGGRYVAFSTNVTSQMFHTAKQKRIEVYDSKSDVFIYDTHTHTILQDTLTMRHLWAECTPAFSPDGRWLYYTTARRQLYPRDYDQERYSLCRVPFDAKTGRLGTVVDTLISADRTGKSVTWPRPSYDGRYLVYTVADYGYFSIWHPEADQWLLDLQTMEQRPLTEANSERAESFHNWSRNSRWLLFTSRRDDGLYTRLYFCHIGHGRASKPFLLPQRNPKTFYRRLLYSYNTPDFVNGRIDAQPQETGRRLRGADRVATNVRQQP